MKITNEVIAAITLAIIVIIPFMPDVLLNLLDHPVFRIGLIVALLLAVQHSVFTGVAVLLIIGVALLQRNSRKLPGVVGGPVPRMVEDAEMPMSTAIVMPAADVPARDEYAFAPQEDTGSDEFVAGTEKFLPASAPLGAAGAAMF